MIPAEIKAEEELMNVMLLNWRFQIMTTNWNGYWIFQLTSEGQQSLAMLIDLNCLERMLGGLQWCIETLSNHAAFPRARSGGITLADNIRTQTSDLGGVFANCDWEKEPLVTLSWIRGDHSTPIRIGHKLSGVVFLHEFLTSLFNSTPGKEKWVPLIPSAGQERTT